MGIRGWSFGGYLAALAVLARPDVFQAAVAGAPVTDWRWYDTYYTERFRAGRRRAPGVGGELVPARRWQPAFPVPFFSCTGWWTTTSSPCTHFHCRAPCSAAGRPIRSALPAVTHVAVREDVAENLLVTQVEFFRHALAEPAPNLPPN